MRNRFKNPCGPLACGAAAGALRRRRRSRSGSVSARAGCSPPSALPTAASTALWGGEQAGTPPFPGEVWLWRVLSVVPHTSGTGKEPALSPPCSACPYGREGRRFVAALRLRNASVPVGAWLAFLTLLDSFPGEKKK